jgi:3-dehydroquinate synthase
MNIIKQSLTINYEYNVFFTEALFALENTLLSDFLKQGHHPEIAQKILFIIDEEVVKFHPQLAEQIDTYFKAYDDVQLVSRKIVIPGGEIAKNDEAYFQQLVKAVDDLGIDRHSYIAAIGGGAILDLAGYAAAVSHRGIKHIRIPTTVLSQDDSGVGVKNGINYSGKKNFLGTFAPPVAVFNDYLFLETLNDRHWRSGISEAVKVALIKDEAFFYWLEENAQALANRDKKAMQYLLVHCARLHMDHIGGGDPFEKGSSRPLDFGHWSAHKLEQLSNFEVLHGEAVSIGIALDSIYSVLSGRLDLQSAERIVDLLLKLGLPVTHPLIAVNDGNNPLLTGLREFQEHLGGRLTIMLLRKIGTGEEVHEMDPRLIAEAAKQLQSYGLAEKTY